VIQHYLAALEAGRPAQAQAVHERLQRLEAGERDLYF
jgi:hypothetical protein